MPKYKMIRIHETTYRLAKRAMLPWEPWDAFIRRLVRRDVERGVTGP